MSGLVLENILIIMETFILYFSSIKLYFIKKNYHGDIYVIFSFPFQKLQALEKYKFEQSLEHTSQFIEKLEKELEEYHHHLAQYRKGKEVAFS